MLRTNQCHGLFVIAESKQKRMKGLGKNERIHRRPGEASMGGWGGMGWDDRYGNGNGRGHGGRGERSARARAHRRRRLPVTRFSAGFDIRGWREGEARKRVRRPVVSLFPIGYHPRELSMGPWGEWKHNEEGRG